jgi:hypothetical protein
MRAGKARAKCTRLLDDHRLLGIHICYDNILTLDGHLLSGHTRIHCTFFLPDSKQAIDSERNPVII